MPMEPYLLSDRGLAQSIANCKRRLDKHVAEKGKYPTGSAGVKQNRLRRDLFLAEAEMEKRKNSTVAKALGAIVPKKEG